MDRGEEEVLGLFREEFAGCWVDELDPLHLVAEELDADRELFVGGPDLDRVAACAIGASHEIDLGPLVLHRVEREEELAARELHPPHERVYLLGVGAG